MSSLSYMHRRLNEHINRQFKSTSLSKYYSPKTNGVQINGKFVVPYDDFFIRSIDKDNKNENFYAYSISAMDTMLTSILLNDDKVISVVHSFIIDMIEKYPFEERIEFAKKLRSLFNSDLSWNDCKDELEKHVFILDNITKLYPSESTQYYITCIIFIWYKSKEKFFKLFILFTDFAIETLDFELNYLSEKPKKMESLVTDDLDSIANTPMYCFAKYIQFCTFLSMQMCESVKKQNEDIMEMKFFNNSKLGDDELLNKKYSHKELISLVNKMLDVYSGSSIDPFYMFTETKDYNFLKERISAKVVCKNSKDNDEIVIGMLDAEIIYREARSLGKSVTRKVYNGLVDFVESHLFSALSHSLIFLGYDLLFNDTFNNMIKERDSLNDIITNLSSKYKGVKSELKVAKKSVEEMKQSKYESEKKLQKAKIELDSYKKESVPKSDFDGFEESYNVLLKQIADARRELDVVSKKLDEKTAECSRLVKENKQFESQVLKLKSNEVVEISQEVVNTPIETKVEFLNNFNVVILGGLTSISQSLHQMGYNSFTQCNDLGDINCGKNTDLIVITTNFVSHKMTNFVKSHYSDIDIRYFNNTNPNMLIDLIYSYFTELLED